MGLAISRRLAESMKGRMWVDSKEGKGSTFSFTIQVCSPVDPSCLPLSPSLNTSLPLANQANLHGLSGEEVKSLRGLRVFLVCETEVGVKSWKLLCASYDIDVAFVYKDIEEALSAVCYNIYSFFFTSFLLLF